MTDTEKDYITIKLCRDEALGVYYTQLKRSEEAKREIDITFDNQEGHCAHCVGNSYLLFYSDSDREKYREANPPEKLNVNTRKLTSLAPAERPPLPGAISPMGIYENYYMPDGYKRLKDTL
jgi:hypothetical protein